MFILQVRRCRPFRPILNKQGGTMEANRPSRIYLLNTEALNKMIAKQGLKRNYLATALNVAPLTINRWTTGKTKRIRRVHLGPLSQILSCEVDDLVCSKTFGIVTSRQQKKVAELFVHNQIYRKLAKTGDYQFLEACLELCFNLNFSRSPQVELYYHLALCCLEQSRYQQALEWLEEILIDDSLESISHLYTKAVRLRDAILTECGR